MSKGIFVAANVAFIIAFALIANAMGVGGQTEFDIPTEILAPSGSGIFDQVIAPVAWAFNAVGSFLQLLSVAWTGVNPLVSTFVFGPLVMLDLFIIYGMVRGGGT